MREIERASAAERGDMGTKSEVKKSCRSVPSQLCHCGDATSNTQTERDRERLRKKERESERGGVRRLQKEGRHMWGPKEERLMSILRKEREGQKEKRRERKRESASTAERERDMCADQKRGKESMSQRTIKVVLQW